MMKRRNLSVIVVSQLDFLNFYSSTQPLVTAEER